MGVILQGILVFGIFWLLYNFLANLDDYEWSRKDKKFENWKDKWL